MKVLSSDSLQFNVSTWSFTKITTWKNHVFKEQKAGSKKILWKTWNVWIKSSISFGTKTFVKNNIDDIKCSDKGKSIKDMMLCECVFRSEMITTWVIGTKIDEYDTNFVGTTQYVETLCNLKSWPRHVLRERWCFYITNNWPKAKCDGKSYRYRKDTVFIGDIRNVNLFLRDNKNVLDSSDMFKKN